MTSGGFSVCCLTAERPAMVAAAMSLLRPFADEIVVAVDSRVDAAALAPLLDVADVVTCFEFVDPPERARPWLVDLCRHEWVLMLDGDEVPSAALLGLLPSLIADNELQQVRIARRWCFPDERSWLDERPWWPDFQRRLLRPGPLLDLDVRFHGGARPALPNRCVEESIYHLVTAVRPFAARRARARRYNAARPNIVAVGGGDMNELLYAPETYATRPPAPTPPEDRALLLGVLRAPDVVRHRDPGIPVVTAAEVAAHIRPGPVDSRDVTVRIAEPDLRSDPGSDTAVLVEITNGGSTALPRNDGRGIELRVATRVLDPSGKEVTGCVHTALPCDVPGSSSRLVDAFVRMPATSGAFVVEVALVNERGPAPRCATTAMVEVTTRWGRFALRPQD